MMQDQEIRSSFHPTLVLVVFALMAVGLVMTASTSASLNRSVLSTSLIGTIFGRQLVFVGFGLGLIAILVGLVQPILASPSLFRRATVYFYAAVVVCLIVALLPSWGHAQRGSHRWLRVGVGDMLFGFQPSELAKVAMVGLMALILGDSHADPKSFRRCFLPASLGMGLCVGLVGAEDFGTAVLLACVGAMMLVVAGSSVKHLAACLSLGAAGLAMLLLSAPYRLDRLTAHFDFWSDPQGAGYQPIQSLSTIASGGWYGTGLGAGIQKYGYLPESHTDFIFAVICEEMGLLGAVMVIALYIAFVYLGLRIAISARTRFERLLAFGLTATLGLQVAMNVAVVTVMAPTTGISLPLISAGGSGVISFSIAVGILAAVAKRAADSGREGEEGMKTPAGNR